MWCPRIHEKPSCGGRAEVGHDYAPAALITMLPLVFAQEYSSLSGLYNPIRHVIIRKTSTAFCLAAFHAAKLLYTKAPYNICLEIIRHVAKSVHCGERSRLSIVKLNGCKKIFSLLFHCSQRGLGLTIPQGSSNLVSSIWLSACSQKFASSLSHSKFLFHGAQLLVLGEGKRKRNTKEQGRCGDDPSTLAAE